MKQQQNYDLKVLTKSSLNDTIGVVVGTRPGIIKFSPVIRALETQGCDYFIAHTGQHYSYNMDRQFFEDLELPEPRYKNEMVQKTTLHGAQTAEMIKGLEQSFLEARPALVIVGGDANTNLAGALAARKLGIAVAHMEAGLRSHDWRMPEEHNRVIIDHISEYLFPPTEQAKQNLLEDNVKGQIHLVGNTIVDAVYQNLEIAKQKSNILSSLALAPNDYFLITSHREENVDDPEKLSYILEGLAGLGQRFGKRLLFPLHPRTRRRLQEFGLWERATHIDFLDLAEPVGYLDFLLILANTALVLTDSGGIQEEACILQVPCVTLRDNTERPETVEVGANMIAGLEPKQVLATVEQMLERARVWPNPFGDGYAGERIVNILSQTL